MVVVDWTQDRKEELEKGVQKYHYPPERGWFWQAQTIVSTDNCFAWSGGGGWGCWTCSKTNKKLAPVPQCSGIVCTQIKLIVFHFIQVEFGWATCLELWLTSGNQERIPWMITTLRVEKEQENSFKRNKKQWFWARFGWKENWTISTENQRVNNVISVWLNLIICKFQNSLCLLRAIPYLLTLEVVESLVWFQWSKWAWVVGNDDNAWIVRRVNLAFSPCETICPQGQIGLAKLRRRGDIVWTSFWVFPFWNTRHRLWLYSLAAFKFAFYVD